MLRRGFQILAFTTALIGTAHANLLTNGNFSAGYSGFGTDYSQVATNGTVFTTHGDYALTYNPGIAFTDGYSSYGDHTTSTGLMLFADGNGPGQNVWSENISVGAGTYTFTGWVANADPTLNNPATLALLVDGTDVGTTFAINQLGGIWEQWTTSFSLSSASAIDLSIQDLNSTASGNDFTIDDLSLTGAPVSTTPEPSSLLLAGSGLLAAAGTIRRKLLSNRLL